MIALIGGYLINLTLLQKLLSKSPQIKKIRIYNLICYSIDKNQPLFLIKKELAFASSFSRVPF